MKEGEKEFTALTLLERLGSSGYLYQFDQVVLNRDRRWMIEILPEPAEWTADTMLANPKKYGYQAKPE